MLTETGDPEFVNGFMAGYHGQPCPDHASDKFQAAYGRGYETAERESHLSETREKVK